MEVHRALSVFTFPVILILILGILLPVALILAADESPLAVAGVMFRGSLGSGRGVSNTLQEATPLILTGLAVALALKAGLFNIGGEGQLMLGGFAAAWVGFTIQGLPAPLHVALCCLAAMVGGAAWASIAGYLRARFGVHEVINTIMLNYIAYSLANYLVGLSALREPGQIPKTWDVELSARLPRVTALYPHSQLNLGILIGVAAAVATLVFLWRTRAGFEVRCVGQGEAAARAAGISARRMMILAMALSGALAGLAGAEQVLGVHYHFLAPFPGSYGFLGIAVALLGANHPLGVVPAALFMGALTVGAAEADLLTNVPRELATVVGAALILCVACGPALSRSWSRFRRERSV